MRLSLWGVGWLGPGVGWLRQAFSWPEWLLFASLYLPLRALGGAPALRWTALLAPLASLSFFVLLKLLDDIMDYRQDRAAQRDSYLQRGQASLGDLRALMLAILAMQGGATWACGGASALPVWIGLVGCAWLLAHPLLAARPLLYSLLHYLLLPGFAWWQLAILRSDWHVQPADSLLMAQFYCGAMQYELSRKLDPVRGYAGVLRLRAACAWIVCFSLLACMAAAALGIALGVELGVARGTHWWAAALACCVFGLVCMVHGRLSIHPSIEKTSRARWVSGLSLLGLNLLSAASAFLATS